MVTERCCVWNLFLLTTVKYSNAKFSIHGMVTYKSAVFRSLFNLSIFFLWDKPSWKITFIASVSNSIIDKYRILSCAFWKVKKIIFERFILAPSRTYRDNGYWMGLRLKFILTLNGEIFKWKCLSTYYTFFFFFHWEKEYLFLLYLIEYIRI